MDRISISILDADLLHISNVLMDLHCQKIQRIHLDILDTSFVDNISFGPSLVNKILHINYDQHYNFKFDVHIMINQPLKVIKLLDLSLIDFVVVHWEVEGRNEAITYLKEINCKIGLAINPDTPIKEITLDHIQLLLIMSVYPGFGGQLFISKSVEKISTSQKNVLYGVDGGVNLDNLHLVRAFDLIVIGSSYFKSENKKEFLLKAVEIISKN